MPETAMVIDDDKDVNDSIVFLLEVLEIKVVGKGYDGKEAIELFSKHCPDYSIIDLDMPKYDGFFAIEGIRKINDDARIWVFTGDITEETKKRLEKLKINGIVHKPYQIKDLVDMMRKS